MSLKARIAALIEAQGPIPVAQFMAIALHDAKEGYYATRDPFGAAGDFITAPEISQVFGELIGLWLVQVWSDQGSPSHPVLVELGPGRGTLMADMLRAARLSPDFVAGLDVVLVEASPTLRAIQQEKLEHTGVTIQWREQLGDLPEGRPVFLVANEFLDALPVHQYVKTARGWCERMVTAKDGALSFVLAPTPVPPAFIPENRAAAPEGGVYEVAAGADVLSEDIAGIIAAQGGAALFIDYGYGEAGFGETLQAVSGHGFSDPLAEPGAHDLSAHVDFTAVTAAAQRAGASVLGPVPQGIFLKALGVEARAAALAAANPAAAPALDAAVARLVAMDAPVAMGALFKLLAFLPPAMRTAPGFAP